MTGPARPPDVRFEHVAAPVPEGLRTIVVRDGEGRVVGRLAYQVCRPCRLGYVECVAVSPCRQGRGIGRRALHTALSQGADHTWSTSRQSADGRRFFAAVAEETDRDFPATAARCPHMLAARPGGPVRNLLARHRL
ncbi:GNAT family N-acetyltransferase [Streptomyces sp. NPDC048566]|uniref:GNAT family N-acetyltransferase n=1 Tax=Streptomyces sp. NPDC048566 TaxID=3365569 RepID=UPI003718EECA